MAVVPVTGTVCAGALYPVLGPRTRGLVKDSSALFDHLRAIDKRLTRRTFGQVSMTELAAIDQGLELLLGLGTRHR